MWPWPRPLGPKAKTWHILFVYKIWLLLLQPFRLYNADVEIEHGSCDPDHAPFRGGLPSRTLYSPPVWKTLWLWLQLFQKYCWCPPKLKWFTWPDHAFSGMFCRTLAWTCYDQPTYQIWSLSQVLHPLQKYERRYIMSEMGWFGVVRGHLWSREITPFDRALKFLLAFCSTMSLSHTVLRYSETVQNRHF